MNETEVLKLRKPAENDFYSVEDFNHNMDLLEENEAKKITTVCVFGDLGSTVNLSHGSGSYVGTVEEHTDTNENGTTVTRSYAKFVLPRGGKTEITHIVSGNKHEVEWILNDGGTEYIISHTTTIHTSPLSRVPNDFFAEHKNYAYTDDNCSVCILRKQTLSELQETRSKFDYEEDYKNHLWHATRTGMITADEYATATGEEYTSVPPLRVTQ